MVAELVREAVWVAVPESLALDVPECDDECVDVEVSVLESDNVAVAVSEEEPVGALDGEALPVDDGVVVEELVDVVCDANTLEVAVC